jgi:hypothetical protein
MLSVFQFENENENANENANEIANDAVHRIFCIDVSGSMAGDLPDIRRQLKNKMPTSIRPQDFMSLIWFSGKGQFGTIFEHISINDLKDLVNINTAIDRYLATVGSTGFVEPIRMAKKLAETYPEQPQVFFLTDGGENVWPKQECLQSFSEMTEIPLVIVEYQYYCDRTFLGQLAEISNGVSLFNENFESYDVSFDNYMKNRVSKSKTVESSLPILYVNEGKFVYKLPTGGPPVGGVFRIPKHVDRVWKVDTTKSLDGLFPSDERDKNDPIVHEIYLTMLFALQTHQADVMEKCVNVLGDVYVSKQYSVCFSKQDESRLCDHISNCINDPATFSFKDGVDVHFVVNNNVFTIIDLLQTIQADKKSRYYPYHPSIVYNRISKEVKEEGVQFIPNRDLGSSFGLVYHQSRANMSVGCQVYGHEKNENEDIKPVTTFRNYTVVKDGIKNMDMIAVSFSEETFNVLKSTNSFVLPEVYEKRVYLLDLKNLPVVNRAFIKTPFTSGEFCSHHVELIHQKSKAKYLKKMISMLEVDEKKSGEEEEKSGEVFERKKHDPNVVRDFYVAPELQVKIAKCSSIPTVNEKLLAKLNGPEGKLSLSESLMMSVHYDYNKVDVDISVRKEWLQTQIEIVKSRIHEVTTYLENAKMAILIGGCWFSNCDDASQKTFSVEYSGKMYEVTVEVNNINVYM